MCYYDDVPSMQFKNIFNKRKLFEYQAFIQHEVFLLFVAAVICYFQQIAIKLKTIFPDVQFFITILYVWYFFISFSLTYFV